MTARKNNRPVLQAPYATSASAGLRASRAPKAGCVRSASRSVSWSRKFNRPRGSMRCAAEGGNRSAGRRRRSPARLVRGPRATGTVSERQSRACRRLPRCAVPRVAHAKGPGHAPGGCTDGTRRLNGWPRGANASERYAGTRTPRTSARRGPPSGGRKRGGAFRAPTPRHAGCSDVPPPIWCSAEFARSASIGLDDPKSVALEMI